MEFMTPEEARTVELSLNPIKRHRQVCKHMGEMGLKLDGTGIATRGTLIRLAEARVEVEATMAKLQEISHVNPQGENNG